MIDVPFIVWVLVFFIATSGALVALFGPTEPPTLRRDSRAPRVVYRVERRK